MADNVNGTFLDPLQSEAVKKQNKLLDEAKKIMDAAADPVKALKGMRPELKKALRLKYGYAYSLILSNPGLTKVFSDAIKQGYTPEQFVLEIKRTNWWKKRDESQAAFDVFTTLPENKGAYKSLLAKVSLDIQEKAKIASGKDVPAEEAQSLAKDLLRDHFNDWATYTERLVGDLYVNEDTLAIGGQAATAVAQIQEHARSMGVYLDDMTLGRYIDNIFAKKDTLENVINSISNLSATYYPQFAENIKAGATVASIAQQYTDTAASMLEVDPATLNFFGNNPLKSDPLMAKAMFGGKDNKAMSLYDFRKAVKQDARWKQTRNAREEFASVTNSILRSFGG